MKAVADHHPRQGLLKAGIYLPGRSWRRRPRRTARRRSGTPERLHHRRHRLRRPAHHQRLGQRPTSSTSPTRARRSTSTRRRELFAGLGLRLPQARRRGPRSFDERRRTTTTLPTWPPGTRPIAATGRPIHLGTVLVPRHRPRGRLEEVLQTAGASTPTSSATATPWSAGRTPSTTAGPTSPPGPGTPGRAAGTTWTPSNVGNGEMDGLTKAERQSYATLWAIAKSPLHTGDDLTRLRLYGLSLLTNRRGHRAQPEATPPARDPVTAVPTPSRCGPRRTPTAPARSPVQPRRRPRRRHRRLHGPRLHRQGRRSGTCWNHENLGTTTTQDHPGAARARLPPVHRSPRRRIGRPWTGYRGRVRARTPSPAAPPSPTAPPAPTAGRSATCYLGGKLTFNDVVVPEAGHLPGARSPTSAATPARWTSRRTVAAPAPTHARLPPRTENRVQPRTCPGARSRPAPTPRPPSTAALDYAPDIDRIDVPRSSWTPPHRPPGPLPRGRGPFPSPGAAMTTLAPEPSRRP